MSLNVIYKKQTKSRKTTQAAADQLLYYLSTQPNTTICYHPSDIIMNININASYFSVSKSHICIGRLFHCVDKPPQVYNLNDSILNVAAVINNLVASAEESEFWLCFQNSQSGVPLRVTLMELGHKKPATPLRIYKSTAFAIMNKTIKQKGSKSMDKIYHWLT